MAEAHAMAVSVINSSTASLAIRAVSLSAGAWAGPAPKVGSVIDGSGAGSWVNGAKPPSMGVGGSIGLDVSFGGRIDITWSWAPDAVPTGAATGTQLNVVLGYQLEKARTDRPQLAVQIRNEPD
jgi:hypothetical protein